MTTDTQLQHEILKKKIGQAVKLTVWRKGQTIEIPVTTGELPNEIARASNEIAPPEQAAPEDVGKLGLQVQDITKEIAERLHLGDARGVIVTDVADNSIAAARESSARMSSPKWTENRSQMCSHSAKPWARPIQSAASCSISTARAAKHSRS